MKLKYTIANIGLIVLILIFILGFSALSQCLLEKDSRKLEITIDKVIKSTENEDWESAQTEIEKLKEEWRSVMKLWSPLVDHHEIDNIDITLLKLKPLIDTKDKSTALSEATALKEYITHIPEKEKLNISNLF